MKFRSLRFPAFGPFTGHHLELSDKVAFHLVYGPNEAGKSSMLRGIRSLLYGIENKTNDDFLHPKSELRIGAAITHSDGRELDFFRRKGRTNTLLDPAGTPLDEAVLSSFLGGVDRFLFERLYGLDHLTLVEGGHALSQGEGDVGQSLFAAGLGPEIRALAQQLQTQAQELWRERGQKYPLNQAIATFKEARKETLNRSLKPQFWQEIEEDITSVEERIKELERKSEQANRELNRLERFQRAYPLASRRRNTLESLQETPETPLLDQGFSERRLGLERQHREHTAALARLQDSIVQTQRLLSEESDYERPIAYSKQIEELYRGLDGFLTLDSKVRKTQSDLERVQSEGDSLALDLAPGVSRLQVKLPAAGTRRQTSQIATSFQVARKEFETNQVNLLEKSQELRELEAQLNTEEDKSVLETLEGLERRLNRESKLDDEIEELTHRVSEQQRRLRSALANLPGYRGDIEELRRMRPLLSEVIERYRQRFEKLGSSRANLEKEGEKLRAELDRLERRRDLLKGDTAPPTRQELNAERQKRNELRDDLSQAWLSGSSWSESEPKWRLFDESLRQTDLLADRLFVDAERVAQISEVEQNIREQQSLAARHQSSLESLEQKLIELRNEWRAQTKLFLETPVSPAELVSWQQLRASVLEEASELERRQNELQLKVRSRTGLLRETQEVLMRFDIGREGLDSAISEALSALTQILTPKRESSKQRGAALLRYQHLEHEIRKLEARRNQLETQLAGLRSQWEQTIKSIGLEAETDPFDLSALLDKYERLGSLLSRERALETDLKQLQQEQEDYRRRAVDLSQEILPDSSELTTDRAAHLMFDCLTRARKARERHQSLSEKLEELRESLASHSEKLRIVESSQRQLLAQGKVETLEELPEIERRAAERDRLRAELEKQEASLQELSGGSRLEAFCEEVLQLDVDLLPESISRSQEHLRELKRLEGESRERLGELRKTQEQLGLSSAGESAAEAEAAATEVMEYAERYMVLTLSHRLLNRQLEEYRRSHQGPILERAQYAFDRLTQGYYPHLETGYDDKDRPILLACDRDNRKVGVDGLSNGTRDQLFLALRLATIEQQLVHHEPVPFVADDLLVHFDSDRALAALQLLAEFSRKTQVLFFTHLERDRDLAATLPAGSVEIHQLPRALGSSLEN